MTWRRRDDEEEDEKDREVPAPLMERQESWRYCMFTKRQDCVEKPEAWLLHLVLSPQLSISQTRALFPLGMFGFPGPLVLNISSRPVPSPSL